MSKSCSRSVVMTTLVRTSLVFGIWSLVKILFECSCTAKVLYPWRWRVCSFLWLHCQQAHITMRKGRPSKDLVTPSISASRSIFRLTIIHSICTWSWGGRKPWSIRCCATCQKMNMETLIFPSLKVDHLRTLRNSWTAWRTSLWCCCWVTRLD